jgi:hypothetical protein
MHKHISKQELLNFFLKTSQKKYNGGGNYLHNYQEDKHVEKKQCGKKSSI